MIVHVTSTNVNYIIALQHSTPVLTWCKSVVAIHRVFLANLSTPIGELCVGSMLLS